MRTEIDRWAEINFAKEQGKVEGKAEGNLETARILIAEFGLNPKDVANRLGMKEEDIAKLK